MRNSSLLLVIGNLLFDWACWPRDRAAPWLTDMKSEMSKLSSPTGGLCLLSGKHTGILTYFQTIVNKKMSIKAPFLVILSAVEGPIKTKAGIAGLKWIYTKY